MPDVYKRVEDVIDSFVGEVGFNPGSQIIQIAGISMLNGIDHFVKERLRVKHYLRYMDDMIVIGADVAELTHIRCEVERQLAKLGFTLHKEKTFIIPVTKGFLFLGFRYVLTATGKVLRIVDFSRVSAERRKLARMAGKVRRSEMTIAKMDQCFQSWLAHASKGNNHGLVRNMKRYYKQLQEV